MRGIRDFHPHHMAPDRPDILEPRKTRAHTAVIRAARHDTGRIPMPTNRNAVRRRLRHPSGNAKRMCNSECSRKSGTAGETEDVDRQGIQPHLFQCRN